MKQKRFWAALALVVGVAGVGLAGCKEEGDKGIDLNSVTLDVPATVSVEIGSDYAVSNKLAADSAGKTLRPTVKAYCGEQDVTASMVEAFVPISSFADYTIVYTVEADGKSKEFTTVISVTDTTVPVISPVTPLPETADFGNFSMPQFTVADNSGETIQPVVKLFEVNCTYEREIATIDELSDLATALKFKVTAEDSHNNKSWFEDVIRNSAQRFTVDTDNSTLLSHAETQYRWVKDTVSGENATVFEVNAVTKNFNEDTYPTVVLTLPTEISVGSTVEFDVKIANMTRWVSIKPKSGTTLGGEQSKAYNKDNEGWEHVSLLATGELKTFDQLVFTFQGILSSEYMIGIEAGGYDPAQGNILVSLANFKFKLASPEVRTEGKTAVWDPVGGATGYQVKLGEGAWSEPFTEPNYTLSATELGTYNLQVRALGDGEYTFDGEPKSVSITIAKLASPVLTKLGMRVSWEAVENALGYQIKVDDGAWSETLLTRSYTLENVSDGVHTVYVKAVGDSAHYESEPASVEVKYVAGDDTTAPVIDFESEMPEEAPFGTRFTLPRIYVSDNLDDVVVPVIEIKAQNGSKLSALEVKEAEGCYYVEPEDFIEKLYIHIAAVDATGNIAERDFTVVNSVERYILDIADSTLMSHAETQYYWAKETVNDAETNVLNINAVTTDFNEHTYPRITFALPMQVGIGATVEFDIKISNMTRWVSLKAKHGVAFVGEPSYLYKESDGWVHATIVANGNNPSGLTVFDKITLTFQGIYVNDWFVSEGCGAYDPLQGNILVSLANIGFKLTSPVLSVEENTVRWNAVSGASGYQVKVGDGEWSETISETSYTLTETTPGFYTVQVKAIGNGTLTKDSDAVSQEIRIVGDDAEAPVISLSSELPGTTAFTDTFTLPQITVTDNSGETIAPVVTATKDGGIELTVTENGGIYTVALGDGYTGTLYITVTATDSGFNGAKENYTITNTEPAPVLIEHEHGNIFTTQGNDPVWGYKKDTVNEVQTDVFHVTFNGASLSQGLAKLYLGVGNRSVADGYTVEFDLRVTNPMHTNASIRANETSGSEGGIVISSGWIHVIYKPADIESYTMIECRFWGVNGGYDSANKTVIEVANVVLHRTLPAPALTLDEMTVNWEAVEGATGYQVKVGEGEWSETISETSYTLTETAPGLYTVQVKAIGNGTTLKDSAPATQEIRIVGEDAEEPVITLETELPATAAFGATYVLPKITVTDNSGETIAPVVTATKDGGIPLTVTEEGGVYTVHLDGYAGTLHLTVTATDSGANEAKETYTITNTEPAPFGVSTTTGSIFTNAETDVKWGFKRAQVNDVETDVLFIDFLANANGLVGYNIDFYLLLTGDTAVADGYTVSFDLRVVNTARPSSSVKVDGDDSNEAHPAVSGEWVNVSHKPGTVESFNSLHIILWGDQNATSYDAGARTVIEIANVRLVKI